MAGCIDVIANLNVAASTGISRVTLLGTSRIGYNGCVIVTFRRNLLRFGMITVLAILSLLALFGASRCLCLDPFAKLVAGCIDVIALVAMITARASIRSVPLLRAGTLIK